MTDIIDISLFRLAFAYIFILLVVLLAKWRGISMGGDIVYSSLRMTLQLILAGYLLGYIMGTSNPFAVLAVLLAMQGFAVFNIIKRLKRRISRRFTIAIAIAVSGGSISCLLFFVYAVIGISPWYDPRYFIPIAGMITGNSMTGVAIAAQRLLDGMAQNAAVVENALMLGAEPKVAARDIIGSAFSAAVLPTINNMVGMGIVSLPGMMTGQILAGSSPIVASKYQIAIILGIAASVAISAVLFTELGYRLFFTKDKQLIKGSTL